MNLTIADEITTQLHALGWTQTGGSDWRMDATRHLTHVSNLPHYTGGTWALTYRESGAEYVNTMHGSELLASLTGMVEAVRTSREV